MKVENREGKKAVKKFFIQKCVTIKGRLEITALVYHRVPKVRNHCSRVKKTADLESLLLPLSQQFLLFFVDKHRCFAAIFKDFGHIKGIFKAIALDTNE